MEPQKLPIDPSDSPTEAWAAPATSARPEAAPATSARPEAAPARSARSAAAPITSGACCARSLLTPGVRRYYSTGDRGECSFETILCCTAVIILLAIPTCPTNRRCRICSSRLRKMIPASHCSFKCSTDRPDTKHNCSVDRMPDTKSNLHDTPVHS